MPLPMQDLATLRALLARLEEALDAAGETASASLVGDTLAGSDEALVGFLVSDELWGGPGSIAEQGGVRADEQDSSREIEVELAALGAAQIALGVVHERTRSWIAHFPEQKRDPNPSSVRAVCLAFALNLTGIVLILAGWISSPVSNLGGGLSMLGGLALGVGLVVLLIAGVAWGVGKIVNRRALVVLLLFPALVSCGPYGIRVHKVGPPTGNKLVAEGTPVPAGAYVHPVSGLQFPETLGGFKRLAATPYNKSGTDVGVGYRLAQGPPLVFTVYIYPHPGDGRGGLRKFDEHHKLELAEVRKSRPDIKELSAGILRGTLAGQAVEGRFAEFEFSGGSEFGGYRVGSVISVFPVDGWLVKYRLTWPIGARTELLAAGERLLSALHFPPTGLSAR